MKKILLLSLFCLFLIPLKAQDTETVVHRFTLEQCLDYAFGNNYNRQSLKLSEEAKEDTWQQSKQERLPSLSASVSESLTHSKNNSSSWNGNYGVNAGVTLYQGGSVTSTIEQNKLKVEQSSFQTSQYENDLTIQILQAFLNVLGNEELLKYQQVVVKTSEEQMKQGEEQFKVGSILESDYAILKAQYVNDKNNITDTEIARDNNLLTLKSLLSMHPNVALEIVYPDTTAMAAMALMPPKDFVMERALETMPDMKISQYNVDIANLNVKLAQAGYTPTLSLNGSVGTGHSNNFSNYGTQLSDRLNEQIGLSLSIPIFSNGRTKSKVTQSRIASKQAELDQKQTELSILQSVAAEYQNVVSAYNKYQTTDIRQDAYMQTFNAYNAQFKAGAITPVDLLQQQNNYINALNDYIQSKYSFMLKRKILDVYMGEKITM